MGGPGAVFRRARTVASHGFGLLQYRPVAIIVRRLLLAVPLLFVVSSLVFFLTALTPGDITERILGPRHRPGAPPEAAYRALAHRLGTDQPLWTQYWNWLTHAVHGDLGQSLFSSQSITQAIMQRFPVTLALTIGSLLVSLVFGVGLGVISALRKGAVGRLVDLISMVGWVVPGFWLAAQLIVVFAVVLGWFPATGYVPIAQSPTEWFRSLVLPVAALSIAAVGAFAKFTREGMLDALGSEYVRMARANGVPPRSVIFQHAFRSAALQVVTLAGLLTVGLLVGTVFVEQVFGMAGLGSLILSGTQGHDLPMVQGVAVFFALIVVVVNLVTDLAYAVLSPKVKL
jgi:peptide/nickel transport system permease protein